MIKKIIFGLVLCIGLILILATTKESKFAYSKSDFIQAPASYLFPFISNFKLGGAWNPYEKKDPNMKKSFAGEDGAVGSSMSFEGNGEVGSGRIEILKIIPNQQVDMKLTMTKPFKAENLVEYRLTPEGDGTRFTWTMSGDGGYITKLVSVFIDCEQMVTKDMVAGIANLKKIAEEKR